MQALNSNLQSHMGCVATHSSKRQCIKIATFEQKKRRALFLPTVKHPHYQMKLNSPQLVVVQAAASDAAFPEKSTAIVSKGSSFVQAVFNVVNVMMGVGLLTLPFALKSSGWAGLLMLWLMGVVTNYSGKVLVECANTLRKSGKIPEGGKVGFEEISEASFGKLGRMIVSAIIYVELFGTCALLFILEGDNLFKLLSTAFASSPKGYMLLAAGLIIPTMWIPDLRSLSFLSAAGITATVTVVTSVAYTLLSGNFTPGAPTALANWSTLPLVFGIMTFCYSGHGVFPAIQAAMEEPEKFPQVLDVAFTVVGALCTVIGAAGYYMYGSGALDVVTFNLPVGFLSTLCASVILINPVAKFALTIEPVAAALAGATGAVGGVPRLFVRTLLAGCALYAALSIPFLASLMSLIGSFMTIAVSVILPSLCHQVLFKGKLSSSRVAWNYFVALLGCVCAAFGTYASIRNIAARAAGAA